VTSPSPSADLSRLRINRDAPPPEVRRALGRNAVIAFSFRITPGLLLSGLVFALVMGLVGGFFPARRAAKQPVVQALR
jgi:ABC-type antimicrobial peptide transport system permease subunit